MINDLVGRRLEVDLLVRELGNWRTANTSGPAYQGLADGLRMLIVDGRVPVGGQLPSERAPGEELQHQRTFRLAKFGAILLVGGVDESPLDLFAGHGSRRKRNRRGELLLRPVDER